jgi:Amt family ammonium transporter
MSTPFNVRVESLPAFTSGWAFCATATTIVSGCVAERTRLAAYVLFSVVLSGVIYPMVVQWVWHDGGFLSHGTAALPWLKFHDFAGSVVVHTVGGTSGLVFAYLVGPRLVGRYKLNAVDP